MRQRAMIAMALVNDPKLLIADEPTTALDVTVQAQILELIERLQSELDTAVVIITHDLGVVAEMADEIAVMYAGRIVEHAPTDDDLRGARAPLHVGPAALDPAPRRRRATSALVPIPGRPPSLINLPGGCSFHPRCPYVREAHKQRRPDARAGRRRRRPPASPACSTAGARARLWAELQRGQAARGGARRRRWPRRAA